MVFHPSFCKAIKKGMRKKGISLRALAKRAGIDSSFLSKVLSGKRNPPAGDEVISEIARILGLDGDVLIISAGRIPRRYQRRLKGSEILGALKALVSVRKPSKAKTAGSGKVKG